MHFRLTKCLGQPVLEFYTDAKNCLMQMPPYRGGGDMIDKVSFEETTYNVFPFRFEAGTPPIAASIGLSEAIDYINNIGMDRIEAYETRLVEYAR
jgi:cysteine desulfurase / selenocysteine lyase